MKRIFTVLTACVLAVYATAVTVSDAAGVFKGNLTIGGTPYPDKEVYILPGVAGNTITFVLPEFTYGAASLGDIVLVDIPMDGTGRLTLEDRPLYIKAISERALVSVLNGVQDGGTEYNSTVSANSAQVLLSIAAPSLPEPLTVVFSGSRVTNRNYAVTNGGFEGSWSNSEPNGWHSFKTATGDFASFVNGNTQQFQQSSDTRPGSAGTHSAMLQSNMVLSAKANGNCTNGQINAGSTSADDPSKNYNFSDPSNSGYNTAFAGNPDSLVFWAKYIPADKNPSNSVNKARAHAVVTKAARYQDPETGNSASVRIAEAGINYAATSTMGWQRISVPFSYTSADPSEAAYMLITFTTNMTPGGGSTYKEGGSVFGGGTYYYDDLYLDDVEMVYNHSLRSLTMNGTAVRFTNGTAVTEAAFSDSEYDFVTTTDGKAAKAFTGYDAASNRVFVYVVADNYSQAGAYSVYTLQMGEPIPDNDTRYAYSAVSCEGEPYSDELFSGLTEAGTYTAVIPNTQGGDSIITLTLSFLPAYLIEETGRTMADDGFSWRGREYTDLSPGVYHDTLRLQTLAGCDSVYVLALHVSDKPLAYGVYEASLCEGESITYEGVNYTEPFTGDIRLEEPNSLGGDSIVHLTVTVHPSYTIDEYLTITAGDERSWEGWNLSTMPEGETMLETFYYSVHGCDSTMVLHLTVEAEQKQGLPATPSSDERLAQKVLLDGKLYIIRKDEQLYDMLGTKIR